LKGTVNPALLVERQRGEVTDLPLQLVHLPLQVGELRPAARLRS
jgi:hypothetical protein